jgi:AbrB family looped-hinge helix DNA binding protein
MTFDKVMSMKDMITVTSKGQTTIPAPIRNKLGLGRNGGVLKMSFNEDRDELIISKSLSIDELSDKLSGYIKFDTKPLTDVDAYYQANR